MPQSYLRTLSPADSEVRWGERLKLDAPNVIVAEELGGVRGFAHYGPTHDADADLPIGEIYAINIHPQWWRRGLGSALLSASVLELRTQGFGAASLWVLEANNAARQFYEILGWQCDGAEKFDSPDGCPALPHLRYRRSTVAV